MKKILFLLAILLVTATTFAQVSVTITSVTPTTKGQFKGDLVTFTVSSPNNSVWGIGLQATLDGQINGGGGIWDYYSASFTTQTFSIFVGFPRAVPKERIYQVTVLYTPNPDYPDPSDADAYVKSQPFTISK